MTGLALLRNRLVAGLFDAKDRETVAELERSIRGSSSPYGPLTLQAIRNAVLDAEAQNYSSAAREINLVHNLPVSAGEIVSWDEKYFYSFELPEYLEEASDISRAKAVVILLGNILEAGTH